jgi:hypothetical protein
VQREALGEQRHDADRRRRHQKLPAGECVHADGPGPALDEHRADAPAHRGDQHQPEAERIGAKSLEIVRCQNPHAAHAKRKTQQNARREPILEEEGAQQGGPDRQCVAHHRRVPRADHLEAVTRGDVPDGHVEHAGESRPAYTVVSDVAGVLAALDAPVADPLPSKWS